MMGACVRAATYMVVLFSLISVCSGAADGVHRCSSKERRALLDFRRGLTDPSYKLNSWSPDGDDDCCQWAGVQCHNITGAVTLLDLHSLHGDIGPSLPNLHNPHSGDISPSLLNIRNPHAVFDYPLGGNISHSLLQLESLTYLDLSGNDFGGTSIPSFFGSMTSLRYLNLSGAGFGGLVPSQLQNLSSIRYLDLGHNVGLRSTSLGWIAHLRSLKYLDMSEIDLHNIGSDLLQLVSMLPSLSELHFSECKLNISLQHLGHVNSSSLQVLDLSNNSLSGLIPQGIGQLKYLQTLYLDNNKLSGPIPWSIGNLTSLRSLHINSNPLNGSIPESIGFLSNLESLSIYSNPNLTGIVSQAHLSTLPNLKVLRLSSASLSLTVGRSWTPPFKLEYLDMSLCKIGPDFPSWLRSQTSSLFYLDMSMSGISDTVPDWFWEFASRIGVIRLSGNQIHGDLTHAWLNSTIIDISSNYFTQLPHLSPNVKALRIRNNSISGRISTFICRESNNTLEYLDISMNKISGELSECWMSWQSLVHLNLGSNNLSGKIPAAIGSLYNLIVLQLSHNRLVGDIPESLNNYTILGFIDLGENQLSGPIPYWIGQQSGLVVLRLRSNKLTGSIPVQLCQLFSIQVLDLGNNNLSGNIPECLSHFDSMVDGAPDTPFGSDSFEYTYDYISFLETLELVTKGKESIYQSILRLVRLIDISNNMLSGRIPDISRLTGLHFLNLSHNHLVGGMPKKVGNMKNLESMDLSGNQLSGEIPESISKLSFLSHLNLSYNNLTGSIPSCPQLQSLNESSFLGNVGLCGAPLSKHCRDDTPPGPKPPVEEEAKERYDEMFWFYVGAGPGFAGAFCGVCSTLYFKPAWRQALFWFLEDMMNTVYVFAYVMVNRIKRRLKRPDNIGAG